MLAVCCLRVSFMGREAQLYIPVHFLPREVLIEAGAVDREGSLQHALLFLCVPPPTIYRVLNQLTQLDVTDPGPALLPISPLAPFPSPVPAILAPAPLVAVQYS